MTLTKIQADQTAFTPSCTNATVRTIDDKLTDVITVKDFGAVGNGTTDDLVTITAGTLGQLLIITTTSSSRDVVVKRTGNIKLDSNADYTLSNVIDTLKLIYNGSLWIEVSRSNSDGV